MARALPTFGNAILARVEERLATIEDRLARRPVNLNVRAPKRAAPYSPPVTRGMVRRPLPLARFLDEKERLVPNWGHIRRSFAPTFGTVAQVLKKKKLAESGASPTYVEQNHRAQLLYTEDDRAVMEQAWELTAAHREELVALHHGPAAVPAAVGPSVLDLLWGGA